MTSLSFGLFCANEIADTTNSEALQQPDANRTYTDMSLSRTPLHQISSETIPSCRSRQECGSQPWRSTNPEVLPYVPTSTLIQRGEQHCTDGSARRFVYQPMMAWLRKKQAHNITSPNAQESLARFPCERRYVWTEQRLMMLLFQILPFFQVKKSTTLFAM